MQILAETGVVGLATFLYFWCRLLLFRVPPSFSVAPFGSGAGQAYGWLRFLQLDALAQMFGTLNYSDYLSPHMWTVVAMLLACRAVVRRESQWTEPEPTPALLPRLKPAPAG